MGYPETGQVTEIVPPSTDFTEGMGRTRGGPARRREGRRMRWRLSLGSAKVRTRATECGPRRPIPKKKIVLKIILKIILRCNFDFETCPNYQPFRNFLVYKISR